VVRKLGTHLLNVLHRPSTHSHHRVALARAIYARTKYVLLDDPLSAVVCEVILSPPSHASKLILAIVFRIVTRRDSSMKGCCVDHSLRIEPL